MCSIMQHIKLGAADWFVFNLLVINMITLNPFMVIHVTTKLWIEGFSDTRIAQHTGESEVSRAAMRRLSPKYL